MKLSAEDFGILNITEIDQAIINKFDCGIDNLNSFLYEEALTLHQNKISFTNCLFHSDFDGVAAYYSMAHNSIKLNESEFFELGVNTQIVIHQIPSVLICKLALDYQLHGHKNGKNILDLAIGSIIESNSPSAARLVVVDSVKEPKVINFYEEYGFRKSNFALKKAKSERSETVKMFLDIFSDN
ncbi:MAG: hypothetical protein WAX04_11675 [Oscillospiraceae bacterium]